MEYEGDRDIIPTPFPGRILWQNEKIHQEYHWSLKNYKIFMENIFDTRIYFWILQKWSSYWKRYVWIVHKTIVLSPNIDKTIDEIFESLIKEYDRMDDRVEGGGFNFKFVSSLNFSCENLNLPRKSPNFLRYKNAKIIPQNNDDGCFQYALALSPGIACYTLM